MALRAAMGDLAGCDVERSVEIEDAVALVVVRVATWLARAQWKWQLSAFQSQNLRLCVDAAHDRVLRWVQVEPHDISVHGHHVHRHPHVNASGLLAKTPIVAPDGATYYVIPSTAVAASLSGEYSGPYNCAIPGITVSAYAVSSLVQVSLPTQPLFTQP